MATACVLKKDKLILGRDCDDGVDCDSVEGDNGVDGSTDIDTDINTTNKSHNGCKTLYSFYKKVNKNNASNNACVDKKTVYDLVENIIISSDIHIAHDNKNANMLLPKKCSSSIDENSTKTSTTETNSTGTNSSELFKNSTPWVEKYRPSCFEDIVLDPLNKTLLKNIIDNNYFPNLLFYGPPGTGKTTTIINLVNVYQEKMNLKNKGLMIHLNASDERGIDIIRNQINSFVNSKSLFGDGMKFVILDEVDYMTKTAQIALRYLLNNYNNNFNVRFCLICNYISRIDESLQTEFVRMRFNQLPENDILKFLQKINLNENLKIKDDTLVSIQKHFMSDIRSMINYMQSNQDLIHECKIIKNDLWVQLTKYLKKNTKNTKNATNATNATNKKIDSILKKINKISREYNIEPKNIIKNYLNYIIRNYNITHEFLSHIENIMHVQDCKTEHLLNYIIFKLTIFFTQNNSQ
jgi:replication factor C subunit 3/5